MIVDIPLNPGCTDSRMDERPVCSPASVAPSNAKEERNKIVWPSQRSHSSKTRRVGCFPRENGSLPHREEEEEEHSIVLFWVLTLGCEIPSLFFCLPASPLTSTHPLFIFCLGSPLPLSRPSCSVSWSCRGPLEITLVGRKRSYESKRKPREGK